VVAKVFTSKSGNTFLNIGAAYPNQTFTGWIPPASPVNKSPILAAIEGKRVKGFLTFLLNQTHTMRLGCEQ
jgi:hypothetical protein